MPTSSHGSSGTRPAYARLVPSAAQWWLSLLLRPLAGSGVFPSMSLFSNLFGARPDPLLGSAEQLVDAANLLGVSSYTQIAKELPMIYRIDAEQWDWVFTIAGVFIAATRLNNLGVDDYRQERILEVVPSKLAATTRDGIAGFEDCKAFFEHTYDGLAELDEYKRDPRFLASDSIGAWMAWNLLQAPPATDAELSSLDW